MRLSFLFLVLLSLSLSTLVVSTVWIFEVANEKSVSNIVRTERITPSDKRDLKRIIEGKYRFIERH